MVRRPLWLATGMVLGVGGTLWAELRLRRALARLEPDHVVHQLGDRFRQAVEAGRSASEQREAELRRSLVPGDVNGNRGTGRHSRHR